MAPTNNMDSRLCAEFQSDFELTAGAEPRIKSVVQQCKSNSADQRKTTANDLDAAVSSEFETDYFSFTSSNSEQNIPSPQKTPAVLSSSSKSSTIRSSSPSKMSSPQPQTKSSQSKSQPAPQSPDSPPTKRVKNSSGAPHYQPLSIVKTPAAVVIRQESVRKNEMKKPMIKKIKL